MGKFFFAVAALSLVLSGCNSSTGTNGPLNDNQSLALTSPGVGSVLVYRRYAVDSITGQTLQGTDTVIEMDTVVAAHISQFGRSNVYQLKGKGYIARELSAFWSEDSSGDISYYEDYQGQPGYHNGWITVPMRSKGTSSFISEDTLLGGSRSSHVETYTYAGASPISIQPVRTFESEYFLYSESYDGKPPHRVEKRYFDTQSGILVRMEASQGNGVIARYELQSASIK